MRWLAEKLAHAMGMSKGRQNRPIDLLTVNATSLQQQLTQGTITSVELVDAYLT